MDKQPPSQDFCHLIKELAEAVGLPPPDEGVFDEAAVDFPFEGMIWAFFERPNLLVIEHSLALMRKPFSEAHLNMMLQQRTTHFAVNSEQNLLFLRFFYPAPWHKEACFELLKEMKEEVLYWQQQMDAWPELILLP